MRIGDKTPKGYAREQFTTRGSATATRPRPGLAHPIRNNRNKSTTAGLFASRRSANKAPMLRIKNRPKTPARIGMLRLWRIETAKLGAGR